MASTRIRDTILQYLPWWLQGKTAGTIAESVGFTVDQAIESLIQGLRASDPNQCQKESIYRIGNGRGIRRLPNEPIESYRVRLREWREAWRHAGSIRAQMMQLQTYFLPVGRPRIRAVHQSGESNPTIRRATWHTLEPDGTYWTQKVTPSNWDFDGVYSKWSRYWIIVDLSTLAFPAPAVYDGGATYDGGWLWDGGPTAGQIDDMVTICGDWKAAHSILWGLYFIRNPIDLDPLSTPIVLPSGETTLPNGNWGSYIDNTTGHPSRLQSVTYAYDLGQG